MADIYRPHEKCECSHARRDHGSAWMDPEPRIGKCHAPGCYCTRFLIARGNAGEVPAASDTDNVEAHAPDGGAK